MSNDFKQRVGHSDEQKSAQPSALDTRGVGHTYATPMALLSAAPLAMSSLFDRDSNGRWELPPLRQTFSSSSLPVPSLLQSDSSSSEESKKRKIHDTDWGSNRNGAGFQPLATQSRRSSTSVANIRGRTSRNLPEQGLRDSSQANSSHFDLSRRNSAALSSPSERGVSLLHPNNQSDLDRTGYFAIPAPIPYRTLNNDKAFTVDSRRPSAFLARQQRHSFGDWDQRRLSPQDTRGSSPRLRYLNVDDHRMSPPRHSDMDDSASPQGSQNFKGGIPSQPSPAMTSASPYQMMTLHTSSGLMQIPVDMQAASKHADEKRRRNAGASARFRERRKRKEVEASATIARLEMQVKELSEDRDYYRHERDYFRSATLQLTRADHDRSAQPGPSQAQRPMPATMNGASSFSHEPDRRIGHPDLCDSRFSNPTEASRPWDYGNNAYSAGQYPEQMRPLDLRNSALPGPSAMSTHSLSDDHHVSRHPAHAHDWPPRQHASAPSGPTTNQDLATANLMIGRPRNEKSTAHLHYTEEDARGSQPFPKVTHKPPHPH